MATGLVSDNPSKRIMTVRMVDAATAANGVPTAISTTTPAAATGFDLDSLGYGSVFPTECTVRLYSTAGSGTMTLSYARVWGYSKVSGKWTPLGTGADTTKGYLNGGASFGEVASDSIVHSEPLLYSHMIDGIYIELGVFGGTATAITVELDFPRHVVH